VRLRRALAALAGISLAATLAPAIALADGATVTRGDLHPFAAGVGLSISGRAQMVRTADGKTIVSLHVEGLSAATAYGSHVHKQACANGDADGHYRFDPAGAAAPPNEIWLNFSTNDAGIGNSDAIAGATADATAMSVVVHAPGGAKIACADLG
jgi:N-acetylmuramoyl-L-alanine amidase